MAEPFEKKHYFLVAAEVVFEDPNLPDQVMRVRLNGVFSHDSNNVGVRQIAKAQEVVQLHFRKRFNENPELNVTDVFIYNIMHLGKMTEREFSKQPEGMKVAENHPGVVS